MSAFDYSKWDALSATSSEDSEAADSGGELNPVAAPANSSSSSMPPPASSGGDAADRLHAVKLTYPSRVTIGPDGVHTEQGRPPRATASPFQPWPTPPVTDGVATTPTTDTTTTAATVTATAPAARHHAMVENANGNDDDDEILYYKLTENGGREGNSHLWAQTRERATVSLVVPFRTKASDIRGFRLRSDGNAFSRGNTAPNKEHDEEEEEEGTGARAALVTALTRRCAIAFSNEREADTEEVADTRNRCEFTFRYTVKTAPARDPHNEEATGSHGAVDTSADDDAFDASCWQLQTLPSLRLRLLVVHLTKEPVALGVHHWWDRCFATDTESIVDTTAIRARQQQQQGSGGVATAAAAGAGPSAFRRAWEEAHASFRQRVRDRKMRPARQ